MEAKNATSIIIFLCWVTVTLSARIAAQLPENVFGPIMNDVVQGRRTSEALVAQLSGPMRDLTGVSNTSCLLLMTNAQNGLTEARDLLLQIRGAEVPKDKIPRRLLVAISYLIKARQSASRCSYGVWWYGVRPFDVYRRLQRGASEAAGYAKRAETRLKSYWDSIPKP